MEPGFYLFLKGVDGPVVPICHMHVQNISLMGCDLAYFLASGLEPSLNIRSKSHHKCLRYFEITANITAQPNKTTKDYNTNKNNLENKTFIVRGM